MQPAVIRRVLNGEMLSECSYWGVLKAVVDKGFNISIIVDGIILYSMIVFLRQFEYIAIIFVLGPTTTNYTYGVIVHSIQS